MTKLRKLVVCSIGSGLMLLSANAMASPIFIALPGGHGISIDLTPLYPINFTLFGVHIGIP